MFEPPHVPVLAFDIPLSTNSQFDKALLKYPPTAMNILSQEQVWFMINLIMNKKEKRLGKIDSSGFTQKMTLTEGTAVKRYERLLSSYGLDMSYQQKKDAHNSPKQSSSVAGPNTTAVAEKTLKQNHINSSERDGTKNPGDEVWSTVSLEKKLCPEAYTTWWLYIPESREMAFVAFLLDGSRSTALRVRLSES